MSNDNRRAERLAEAIREEVASFLSRGAKDPRITALVTVTGVEVTPDKRRAAIFVSLMGDEAERRSTLEGLHSATSHLRSLVAKRVQLRFAPELEFRIDQSVEHASRIESLLAKIREEEKPAAEDPID